ncbi:hypothetical protein MXF13_01135 [Leclercia adecarboxylata]|uniref:hypothetical protein n=1 Tax=Leclercia TaxID=83654 RepID=UPI002026C342|nr:hypothetical protein [Leclercia adecarboxylata]MCZ7840881.1 hypothetical protein [Leclercia adecarboxylata]MEB5748491.1 hypothetical protein [Leclercia adecarboxylata]UYM56083.1 hypothetical protein N5937_01860 [Leclercia adecarboxylata]
MAGTTLRPSFWLRPSTTPAFDGCFLVNACREPVEALTLVRNFRSAVVAQPGLNIPEEDARENRDVMADIIWSTLAEACPLTISPLSA